MIALRRAQGVFKRFLNTAASASVKIDKCTAPLSKNCAFPLLEISDFVPLLINEEIKASVENVVNEYNFMAMESRYYVPSEVNLDTMKELLLLETRCQRIKYLRFCFKKERAKLNSVKKKLMRMNEKSQKQETMPEPPNDHIQYGVGKTSLFMHVNKKSLSKMSYMRQANALLFGQNVVIDLDYEPYMMRKEVKNSASQLTLLLGANRQNKDPYNVHFCNAKVSGYLLECLQKMYPCLYEGHGFVNCTELSYLDLFPKEKLVYLSPHASETLRHYDPTAVYIIGAFVDVAKNIQVSNKKAEEEGIKSYALPLDEHIMWGAGTKSLSINQVFEIMLEMKNTNDWKKALKFVPIRKMKRLDTQKLTTEELPDKIYVPGLSSENKNAL